MIVATDVRRAARDAGNPGAADAMLAQLPDTPFRLVLTVDTGLDVPDGGLRARAESLEPRLRDAYVRFLSTYAAGIGPGAAPNADAIAAALQRSTDQVLGRPGARLLLGTVLVN